MIRGHLLCITLCKKPLISVHVYHLLYPVCKIGLKLRQYFCYVRKKRTNLFPNLILYLTNLSNSKWNINCLHPHFLSMDYIHGWKSYPSFQPWKTLSPVDDFHIQKFSPWQKSFRSCTVEIGVMKSKSLNNDSIY